MRELLISDVDGTMVRNDLSEDHPEYDLPSPRAIEAVRQMHAERRFLSPATSRTPGMMGRVAMTLDLHERGVLNGGATIFDFSSGRRIDRLSRELDAERVARIVNAIGYYCTEIYYGEELGARTPDTINIEEISSRGAASVFAVYPNEHEAIINQALTAINGLTLHPNTYDNTTTHGCVQVVAQGVGKRSGVELLLQSEEYQELEGQDIAVIGDGWNDIELFEAVPSGALKIAMGNAGDALKQRADVVVPSVYEDGFAVAVEEYILR